MHGDVKYSQEEEIFPGKNIHTETYSHRKKYSQENKYSLGDVFTVMSNIHTKKYSLGKIFTRRNIHREKYSHGEICTGRNIYTERNRAKSNPTRPAKVSPTKYQSSAFFGEFLKEILHFKIFATKGIII